MALLVHELQGIDKLILLLLSLSGLGSPNGATPIKAGFSGTLIQKGPEWR